MDRVAFDDQVMALEDDRHQLIATRLDLPQEETLRRLSDLYEYALDLREIMEESEES